MPRPLAVKASNMIFTSSQARGLMYTVPLPDKEWSLPPATAEHYRDAGGHEASCRRTQNIIRVDQNARMTRRWTR